MLASRIRVNQFDCRIVFFYLPGGAELGYYSKETNQFWVADLCEFIADPELRRHFLAGRMKEFV